MIALTYINKVSATIEAMKDYELMKLIIATTSRDVKDTYDQYIYINTPKNDGMPKNANGNISENILINHMNEVDIILQRYKQAIEYMQWFEPAWQSLTKEQQLILKEFYMKGSQRSGASKRIQEKINYSERQIERIRKEALSKLTNRLYGR